ncbi:DNA alkylation repair protein [Streptomyces sp. NPDC003042]
MKDVAPFLGIRTPLRRALSRAVTKTDPDVVRAFVTAERARLSPLSVREALKNL